MDDDDDDDDDDGDDELDGNMVLKEIIIKGFVRQNM